MTKVPGGIYSDRRAPKLAHLPASSESPPAFRDRTRCRCKAVTILVKFVLSCLHQLSELQCAISVRPKAGVVNPPKEHKTMFYFSCLTSFGAVYLWAIVTLIGSFKIQVYSVYAVWENKLRTEAAYFGSWR